MLHVVYLGPILDDHAMLSRILGLATSLTLNLINVDLTILSTNRLLFFLEN